MNLWEYISDSKELPSIEKTIGTFVGHNAYKRNVDGVTVIMALWVGVARMYAISPDNKLIGAEKIHLFKLVPGDSMVENPSDLEEINHWAVHRKRIEYVYPEFTCSKCGRRSNYDAGACIKMCRECLFPGHEEE